MDKIRNIAILIFLHVRKETTELEEKEINAWRAESLENEEFYLQLTDLDWAINFIREDKEDRERFEKMMRIGRRYFDGVRRLGEPGFIPPPDDEWPPVYKKTLEELNEEDLAKWPHSKLEYWIHEIELYEEDVRVKRPTVREYFETLLRWGGLINTPRSRRIATLLFLHVRKETSKSEENEIADWRGECSENELLYLKLTDMDYIIDLIEENKKFQDAVKAKIAAKYPYFTEEGRTIQEEHEETISSQTRYTRLEYWIHELEDYDKGLDPPIRKVRKKKSNKREIILPVKFINKDNI